VRWRRWNFPESVAAAGPDSGAHPDAYANSNTNSNTHTDTDANANANAEWRDDDHHHLRGCVTADADCAGGNTRNVREQRHAVSRDGLRSASGTYGLSGCGSESIS